MLGTLPTLSKHGQGQKNNGHTRSLCLDKPVLVRDAQHNNGGGRTLTSGSDVCDTDSNFIHGWKPQQNSSMGLQYQSECCCEQEEPSQIYPAPLSLYSTPSPSIEFLTVKTMIFFLTRNDCSTKCPLCVHRAVQKFADRPG